MAKMCRPGLLWYSQRDLIRDAYQVDAAGVGILLMLLSHHSALGAWPSSKTIAAELGARRRRGTLSKARQVSTRTIERSLASYVRARMVEAHRRRNRPTVYRLADRYLSEATHLSSSTDKSVASLRERRTTERTPVTPAAAAHAEMHAGGETPPEPPATRFAPAVDRVRVPDAAAAPPPAPASIAEQRRERETEAAELLVWYGERWSAKYGRPYLPQRIDRRRILELLAVASRDGARDRTAWVRSYLVRYLAQLGRVAEHGHRLRCALWTLEACRPERPRPKPRPAPEAPPEPQLQPEQLHALLEDLAAKGSPTARQLLSRASGMSPAHERPLEAMRPASAIATQGAGR